MTAPTFRDGERTDDANVPAIIAAHKYYSVDIFDTLLFRLSKSPIDVFRFMEQRPAVAAVTDHFAEYRVAAEQQARADAKENDVEEVTFAEIYACFREMTGCSEAEAAEMQRLELDTETALLQPTQFAKKFLSFVASTEKRYVLTSDMYLPRAFLEDVLTAKGITGWERVFVSNEQRRTKHIGTLYQDVIDHFGVAPDQILHIGDNKRADGKMAKQNRLNSHVVLPSKDLTARSRTSKKHSYIFDGRQPMSQIFIAHYLERRHSEIEKLDVTQFSDDDYFEAFGAALLAPVLMSMMLWLKSEMDKKDLKRIAFLARDGFFPSKLFKLLWPENYETAYVAASRRLLTLPFTQLDETTIHNMFRSTLDSSATLDEFLEKIAGSDDLVEVLAKNGFEMQQALSRDSRKSVLQTLKNNPGVLYDTFEQERDTIKRYFRSAFPAGGKTALFDVGWRGSLQRSVCEIVEKDAEIQGFYFGTSRPAATILARNGLAFESFSVSTGLPKSKEPWVSEFRDVAEFLFSANHGTVLKVLDDGQGGFTWVTSDISDHETQSLRIAEKIQTAALNAILAVTEVLPLSFLQEHTSSDDDQDLLSFLSRPKKRDALRFRDIRVFVGVGDVTGESLTRIGTGGSHYRNVKQSRWRAAYGSQLSRFQRSWVNFRLRKRKEKMRPL